MSDTMDQTVSSEIEPEPLDNSTGEQGAVTTEEPTEASYFDLDQYGDQLVQIQVDGEVQAVPLAELRGGYQRQADYTRKSQEIAAQRQTLEQAAALQEALEANPKQALAILSAVYGDVDDTAGEDEILDPVEARLVEVEQRLAAEDSERQRLALVSELDGYKERHGVDQQELLQFAVDNGNLPLNIAYAALAHAKSTASTEASQATANAEAQRTAAKRGAAFVAGGVDRSASSSSAPVGQAASFREAWDQAAG